MAIYLQHKSPGPEREANWLPAPDGPFALALRIYWPGHEILDGKWEPSAIEKAWRTSHDLRLKGDEK